MREAPLVPGRHTDVRGEGERLLNRLRAVNRMDVDRRLKRLVRRPVKAALAKILPALGRFYPEGFKFRTSLFWGERMTVIMPEGFLYVRYGYYEGYLTGAILRMIGRGVSFIDVGAHFGYFSLLASRLVGEEGRVHAFEPTPRTFEVLSRNLGGKRNVVLNKCAVFSGDSGISLTDYGPEFAGYNSYVAPRTGGGSLGRHQPLSLRVQTVTLDDYTRDWGRHPVFIKIDAESAEWEILNGMRQTLERLRPALAIEVGDFQLEGVPTSREVITRLLGEGYVAYSVGADGLVPHKLQESYAPGNLVLLPAEGWG